MNLNDFDYYLPKELIAQEPSTPRSASRLLVAEKNLISKFDKLDTFLGCNDVLVINNTKVIPAVIIAEINKKKIKITLHSEYDSKTWKAFAMPSKLVKAGNILKFKNNINASVISKVDSHVELLFDVKKSKVYKMLNEYGELPIPPYIKTKDTMENNQKKYQSIFSKTYGAFASPTASLHVDRRLYENIKKKIDIVEITLHVGAGTFLPLRDNFIENNKLHKEKGFISDESASKISIAMKKKKNIVALGTTVLRLLEDCYAKYSDIRSYSEDSDIFIYPGFKFNVVSKLITNFHLPKSSLFLLVSAFGGNKKVMNIYKNAVKNKMRFFSYGDGMIINRYDKF